MKSSNATLLAIGIVFYWLVCALLTLGFFGLVAVALLTYITGAL